MESTFPSSAKTILFDLDNTLCDHRRSIRLTLTCLQKKQGLEHLRKFNIDDLVEEYETALEYSSNVFTRHQISWEDTDWVTIRHFLDAVKFPDWVSDTAYKILDTFEQKYRLTRQATPGSRKVPRILRAKGYEVAVFSMDAKGAAIKAESSGIRDLAHHFYGSAYHGSYGSRSYQGILFKAACRRMEVSPRDVIMVADCLGSDIQGALRIHMPAVMYAPSKSEKQTTADGNQIPVVQSLEGLLKLLGVNESVSDDNSPSEEEDSETMDEEEEEEEEKRDL